MKDKFNKIIKKAGDKAAKVVLKGLYAVTEPKEALNILKHKVKGTYSANEQMTTAAAEGNYDKVKDLLKKGADINYKSPYDGNTVLHTAIGHNETAMIDFLLDNGADPRLDGGAGPTLCQAPARLIPRLLVLGCDPNSTDYAGSTLYRHAGGNDPETVAAVKALLDSGADPNAKGFMGLTPLMIAAQSGAAGNVELLLKAGAQMLKDQNKRTPLDIVRQNIARSGALPPASPAAQGYAAQDYAECLRLLEAAVKTGQTKAASPKKPKAP